MVERAAALTAVAGDARVRRLAGDQAVTPCGRGADRQCRQRGTELCALGIKHGAEPKRVTLKEYVAARQGAAQA
jgi:hypothetical protein